MALALCLLVWKINSRWVFLFTFLFFVSEPSVFLVLGPFHLYGLYAVSFFVFLFLAKGTDILYHFLKTQERLVLYLFWSAIIVFTAGIIVMSISEIGIRRDALTFWTHESKRHPTAQSLEKLADAFYNAKDLDKAKECYQKAVLIDPKSIRAYEALAKIGQEEGQWGQVIESFQKMIEIDHQFSDAYLGLGEAFRNLGQKTQVVETYSHLLALFPDDDKIYVKVIQAYGRAVTDNPDDALYKEKREEVLADYEQLSKRKNYKADDYYNLGFLYEQVGGKEEAIRFYTKAVQMRPDYPEALYHLANLFKDTGNFKNAMAVYVRLAHFHPKDGMAYLNMGIIFNAIGDHQRARQFYLKAIHLEPENTDAYFNLGYLSESQGELNDAVNYYEKAVEVAPKNAEAYYNLGNVYASLGQNGEAIASYLKTVGINPHHQDAFVNLSILSFKAGDFKGAIRYLENAKSLGYVPPIEYLKTLEPYREKR